MSVYSGEVHPVAAMFPMLGDDELAELAADIKANGLHQPIVLDGKGVLIDGRNRLAACERAGVEPSFVVHDGDPVAFILGTNLARRHLSKGQKAMIAAKARLETRHSVRSLAAETGLDKSRISQANVVLTAAPALVDSVIAGTVGLDAAYAEAKKLQDARTHLDAKFATLQAEAPDLAEAVLDDDNPMDVTGAWAQLEQRRKDFTDAVDRYRRGIERAFDAWPYVRGCATNQAVADIATAAVDALDDRTRGWFKEIAGLIKERA